MGCAGRRAWRGRSGTPRAGSAPGVRSARWLSAASELRTARAGLRDRGAGSGRSAWGACRRSATPWTSTSTALVRCSSWCVFERLPRRVAGERRLGDGQQQAGRVPGRGGERREALLRAHYAACGPRGPSSPKSTASSSPLPLPAASASRRPGGLCAGGGLAGRLGGLVGDLALAHPGLGLAVGEDRAEVAADRLGAHPGLVAVAEPLLGLRREDQQIALALAADRWTCLTAGPIGSTTGSSAVYR